MRPVLDIESAGAPWVVTDHGWWEVWCDLPGVKRDDITVDLVGSELEISGEVKETERAGLVRVPKSEVAKPRRITISGF